MTGCVKVLSVLAATAAFAGVANAQPTNDFCGDASVLTDGSVVSGSLVDATNDGNSSCGLSALSPDVWYSYTPAVSATVTISMCGTATFDTALSIHSGCGGIEIACNDDSPGCDGFTSELVVDLVGGVTYVIRVMGFDSQVGDFTLALTGGGAPPTPVNDDCANSTTVEIGTTAFTSVNATTDGPAHPTCLSNGETLITSDVWFTHTAAADGNLVVATCGSSFDTFMAVYDGPGCDNLEARLITCNDDAQCGDAASVQSVAVVPVSAGQTCTIRVGGFNGATGEGVLELSMQAPQGDRYAIVFADTTIVPGVGAVENEDVVTFNTETGAWELLFDGSDVGLSAMTISGFAVTTEDDFLFSFTQATNIPGMTNGPAGTALDDADIVRFVPTSLGDTTAGDFLFYLDGSDVGLTHEHESIDAISRLPDGRIIMSLSQNGSLPNIPNVKDEDLTIFTPSLLGPDTSGVFAMLLEGSDVALKAGSEDIDGVMIGPDGSILISTTGDFSVEGLSGPNEDLISFSPTSLGVVTSGTFATMLDLSALGISSSANVSAMELLSDGAPMTQGLTGEGEECWADYNRDGAVSIGDLFAFLSDYFSHNAAADFDSSGTVTSADLLAFIAVFFAGCGSVA